MNNFNAVHQRTDACGSRYYTLFVSGYKYSIGSLKFDATIGLWLTYCGGRRDIAFSDFGGNTDDRKAISDARFDSAANALAAFRARYEAAECRAAGIRANAFAKIAGKVPEIVATNPYYTTEVMEDLRIVVNLVFSDDYAKCDSIEFECSAAEALAFMECTETNVNVEGRTYTMPDSVSRDRGFAKWCIPAFSKHYHIEGICRSANEAR